MTEMTDRIKLALNRGRAYRKAFLGEGSMSREKAVAVVMADLAWFCRANRSSVAVSPVSRIVDTHATMLAEGRREVFNRITHYLKLTDEQIANIQERSDES